MQLYQQNLTTAVQPYFVLYSFLLVDTAKTRLQLQGSKGDSRFTRTKWVLFHFSFVTSFSLSGTPDLCPACAEWQVRRSQSRESIRVRFDYHLRAFQERRGRVNSTEGCLLLFSDRLSTEASSILNSTFQFYCDRTWCITDLGLQLFLSVNINVV